MGRKPYKHAHLPPGMRAMAKAKGVLWYYLEQPRQADGRRPRLPLGNDYVEALRQYAELVQTASAPAVTVPELLTKWQIATMADMSRKSKLDIVGSIRNLTTFFSDPTPAPLDAIEPHHLTLYMQWREKQTKRQQPVKVAANRDVAWFSAAWNWARTTGLTKLQNPCAGVKRNREKGRKHIYPEDSEVETILAHADIPLREAIDLAYIIAQRPGDLRQLAETDIRDGRLVTEQSKTGNDAYVKIEGDLATWLRKVRERKALIDGVRSLALLVDEKGQPLTQGKMRYRWDKARRLAAEAQTDPAIAERLASLQFRDIRAKAGTDQAKDVGLYEAKELLGHADQATTETHYVRRRLADAATPLKRKWK
jgi:integrase